MSYSTCLKCGDMVGWYDKYCSHCQEKFGLPNLPDWQKTNFTHQRTNFADWAKKEVEKDMAKIKGAGKQADKTKQEKLIGLLKCWRTFMRREEPSWKAMNWTKFDEQAYKEIVAIIKNEVANGPVDK